MAVLTLVTNLILINTGIIRPFNGSFRDKVYQVIRILVVAFTFSFVPIPSATFLIYNVENVDEATDAFYTIFGFGIVVCAYIVLVIQQLNIKKTLTGLGNVVEKSMYI